jgi:lysophospholipase L1-like esterase
MRSTLIGATVLALSVLGQARAAAAPIKVACVGDSITQLSGWPGKLGVELGAGYTSTNYGLAGTTLLKNGSHPYWTTQQFKDSHSANPDIVVIMLGTNDSMPQNWGPHSGEFVGDYESLIDSYAVLPSHPMIYLNLPPPAGTNGYKIDGTIIENDIIPEIKQVAAAKSLPTIDVFDAFGGHDLDPSLYGGPADLVHPNAKGAQVIADTVYAALSAAPSDGGVSEGGTTDAGGAKSDAPADAGGGRDAPPTSGAAGTGASSGAGGAAGAPATAGASGGAGVGGAGVTATGTAGAGPGAAGATGTTGAAGAGAQPPHASSGGCALAAPRSDSPTEPAVVAGLVGLAALVVSRRRR